MKTLTQLSNKQANKNDNGQIKVQAGSVGYIPTNLLKKYLEVADAFLSNESKYVIQYLINHNLTYVADFAPKEGSNALAWFYNYRTPKNTEEEILKTAIKKMDGQGRLLEIPVFQTKEQFSDIINKKVSPDEIIIDLASDRGRSQLVKRYMPLIHKICKQFNGKSSLTYDDLYSSALEGFVDAMNMYGKVKSDKTDEEAEAIKGYTFGQYAAYIIRAVILDSIKNTSHLVRIPVSQQRKEKQLTGHNVKNHSMSGDKAVGGDEDEGNKTLFDVIPDTSDASHNLDDEDVITLWKDIYAKLEDKLEPKIVDIFCSFYGINGYKKLKNKELALKYGVRASQITYYCFKVREEILKDPKLKSMFEEVYELMKECNEYEDQQTSLSEPLYINTIESDEPAEY